MKQGSPCIRRSPKSPVNEINLSEPICRVSVTLAGLRAVRTYAMHATDNIFGAPWPPCDIVIHHHFRVHPVRPLDKGVPSFPATCEFDHRRLDREKAHDPCSPLHTPRIWLDYDIEASYSHVVCACVCVESDFQNFQDISVF